MSETQIAKDTVRAFYESYNQKDLNASFDDYISADLVIHGMDDAVEDRATWLAGDLMLFPAFADFTQTVLDQVAEGDKVATFYRLGGTHTGEFFGLPASGNTAFLTGISIDRVENGRIVEHWSVLDFIGFLQKLAGSAIAYTPGALSASAVEK